MRGPVLVLNAGSSSLKCRLYAPDGVSVLARAVATRLGDPGGSLEVATIGAARRRALPRADHADALGAVLAAVSGPPPDGPPVPVGAIGAVGHRVVHGGERYSASVLIDDEVVAEIERQVPLAPLHNPANLLGIRAARDLLPGVPQVAVFDTAFHRTLPPAASTYALPATLRALGLRRYGFHGTSYRYASARAAAMLGEPLSRLRLVVCHLGNGSSVAAVDQGRSVDTSMGLTPLEGLVMGTRSGDLDPGLVLHLIVERGYAAEELARVFNHESGLLGLSEVSNDERVILERARAGDEHSALALEVYAHRLRKYIGAYVAVMGGIDALVFTDGIGRHSAEVRRRACQTLGYLGVALDPVRNATTEGKDADVSAPGARVPVLVVATDEESVIARDTIELVG